MLTPVLTDAETIRTRIRSRAVDGLKAAFPMTFRDHKLELQDIEVQTRDFGPHDQKTAILEGASLHEPVKATVVLKDPQGKVVEQVKNFTLMHLPYFTERHTFVVEGNEYQVSNQIRMRPGVYTRKKANEDLETVFNTVGGPNFRMNLDTRHGLPYLRYESTQIPLYPVLRQMGLPHADISRAWGHEVADTNRDHFDGKMEQAVDKLYKKVVHPAKQLATTPEAKLQAINEVNHNSRLDPEVSGATLGHPHDKVTPHALLDASRKLLTVYKSTDDVDDRDSLAFKTFHSVDDFIKERIGLDARTVALKVRTRASNKTKIREILPAAPFTSGVRSFLTSSQLSAIPTQINPMEIIDHAVKITSLGEGGIENERQIPMEARQLHPTHLGILDPVRTPESFKAGVDIRTSMLTHRDEKGNLYTTVRDTKTNKYINLSAKDLQKAIVAFPNQKLTGMVDAMKDGRVQHVQAKQVPYQLFSPIQFYSPATNLIPFIESIQGNRATMGAKMQTQALPLVDREAPWVQVGAPKLSASGKPIVSSFEREMASLMVPTAQVAGRIAKIDHQYIYIDPTGKVPVEHTKQAMYNTQAHDVMAALRKHGYDAVLGNTHRDYADIDIVVKDMAEAKRVSKELQPLYPFKDNPNKGVIQHSMPKLGLLSIVVREKRASEKTADHVFKRVNFKGIPVHIDRFKGFIKKFKDALGGPKEVQYKFDYGFIPGVIDNDGEELDVFLGPDETSTSLYLVKKFKLTSEGEPGDFDEHKCFLGFSSKSAAIDAFDYHIHPKCRGEVTEYTIEQFKEVLRNKGVKVASAEFDEDDDLPENKDSLTKFATAVADPHKGLIKVPYENNFPFASKTYLTHDLTVKPGDKVTAGQQLAGSNFTKDGVLALGKNMRIAYMAYYGLNSNDAVVISEGASKKFTSEHMYKEVLDVDPDVTVGRDIHRQYFGSKYTAKHYGQLDSKGVVKKGQKVLPHDPLIVGVRRVKASAADALLGNLKKSLIQPFREEIRTWEHDFEGEVVDVFQSEKRIVVTVKTQEPMRIGDKLAGRYGNKGVVSHIVPDPEMVRDAQGRPVDVLYTSAGVISRINPAQIIETAVAKVAEKTGKPIIVDNFTGRNNVEWARSLLKEHGVKDKETVFDPVSGKHINNIFVGPQYTFRLFKTTDSNFSARGTGGYDVNLQPSKGGDEGSKSVGKMEFNALVAHNARNVLRETATIKSQNSEEFWRASQLGLPLPALRPAFVYDKFLAMLKASGVNVDKQGHTLFLKPLTDADTRKMSAGVIENERLVRAKDLKPEHGGLFDPVVTGGTTGTKWSHVELAEPIVSPVFVEPVRRLLGLTNKDFNKLHSEKGGAHIKKELAKIDVDDRIAEVRKSLAKLKGSSLDGAVKQLKYLTALKRFDLKPHDAYIMSALPVLPPYMRPILPGRGGSELVVGDSNYLYQNALLHNKVLRAQNEDPILPPEEHATLRSNLHSAVGAVLGMNESDNPKLEKRSVKGFMVHLTGKTTPKSSFFQKKVERRQQDLSGRGTAAPDGSLGMDQIGLPEEMLWPMFSKFIVTRLIRRGFSAIQAKDMLDTKHPAARDALLAEIAERPVMVNRAPTLHRYNVVGAYALPVAGKTIRVNPFIEKGMNLDYDGDTLQVHTPVLPGAVHDVKQMTLSNLLFGDKSKDELMVTPAMEAVLGVHLATNTTGKGKVHHFKSKEEAIAAYKSGKLALNDYIEVK